MEQPPCRPADFINVHWDICKETQNPSVQLWSSLRSPSKRRYINLLIHSFIHSCVGSWCEKLFVYTVLDFVSLSLGRLLYVYFRLEWLCFGSISVWRLSACQCAWNLLVGSTVIHICLPLGLIWCYCWSVNVFVYLCYCVCTIICTAYFVKLCALARCSICVSFPAR